MGTFWSILIGIWIGTFFGFCIAALFHVGGADNDRLNDSQS